MIQLQAVVYCYDAVNSHTDLQFAPCEWNNGAEVDGARFDSLSDLLFK